MAGLSTGGVAYALEKFTDGVNELLEHDTIVIIPEDIQEFFDNYEDYERNSWLTTQE